jgi:mRNA-degrading endonuclease toxin of MazEF toxin-antitoxin module
MIELKIRAIPLITTVRGAPIIVALEPANKFPKGVILLNAIA